jgi:transcription elongation factor/antiterminator RfaH
MRMPNRSLPSERNQQLSGRWYAVHTQPHRETRAAANLQNQGFAVFLPLHRKTVRHARRFRTVTAPLFPRYLFVCLAVGRDRWRCVNSTYGVSRLVMEGELPKPVPPGVIDEMQAIADPAGLLALDPRLAPGQQVRIVTGPFTGLVGKLLTLDDNQRVDVLLNILGTPTRVAVAARGVGLVPAA